jgi:hypothetical protein
MSVKSKQTRLITSQWFRTAQNGSLLKRVISERRADFDFEAFNKANI